MKKTNVVSESTGRKITKAIPQALKVMGIVSGLALAQVNCGGGGGGNNNNNTPIPTVDTTPNAFSITPATGVALGATVESDVFQITGINSVTPISVSNNGQISIKGGAYSPSGIVNNNDAVKVRGVASNNHATKFTWTVTAGGVTADFSATTINDPLGTNVVLTPIVTNKPTFQVDVSPTIQFSGASDIEGDPYKVEKYLALCHHSSVASVVPDLSDTRWTIVKPQSVTADIYLHAGGPEVGTYVIEVYPLVDGQIGKPVTTNIEGVWSVPQFSLSFSDDWDSVSHPNGNFTDPFGLKLLMGLPGKGIGNVTITPPTGINVSDIKSTMVSLSDTRYITYTINSPTSITFQTKPGDAETDYQTKAEATCYVTVNVLYHDTAKNTDATFTKIFTAIDDIKYIGKGQ